MNTGSLEAGSWGQMVLIRDALRSILYIRLEQKEDIGERGSREFRTISLSTQVRTLDPVQHICPPHQTTRLMQSWDHPLLPKDNTDSTCWQSPIIPRAQPQLAQHLPDDSCKGRQKETGIENEHVQFWPWAPPPIQLPTQPLTLIGLVAIDKNDTQNHHEKI